MSKKTYACIGCDKPLPEWEPEYCCSGMDYNTGIGCGCFGIPLEPPCCSDECYDKAKNQSGQKSAEPDAL